MVSRDVIHSFFVPAFRVKQDVLPGRSTTIWFTATHAGSFDLFCAEFCGTGHSQMLGQVVALDPAAFAAWQADGRLDAGASPDGDLARQGRDVAARHQCLACHTLDGTTHNGPSWAGLFGSRRPLVGGGEVVADEAYLTESMMDPRAKVLAGFPPIMPTYQGLLDPGETAALVEFIKSLPAPPASAAPGIFPGRPRDNVVAPEAVDGR
jgi:cytochrome c oxidase subunit 2